jgi:hypothetical protein
VITVNFQIYEWQRATANGVFYLKRVTDSGAFGLNATSSGAFNPYKFSQTQTDEHLRIL